MSLNIEKTQLESICKKHKLEVNPDTARTLIVYEKLLHNVFEHGIPYCPCQGQRTPETICPCKFVRDAGACRCGLFIREKANG